MPRAGITVYLPPELEAQVLRVAKSRDLSASGVIAAAVKTLFADNPNGLPDGATRQLTRIEARQDKTTRDVAIMKEALFVFVRVWLEYNPQLGAEEKDATAEEDEARFELFLDYVRRGLERRGSITRDWEETLGEHQAEARR